MTPDNQRLVAVVCYCPYPFLSVASVKLVVILRILDFLDIIQKTVDVQTIGTYKVFSRNHNSFLSTKANKTSMIERKPKTFILYKLIQEVLLGGDQEHSLPLQPHQDPKYFDISNQKSSSQGA